MKRFSLLTIAAGLTLAVMSGPLAFADQYPNHGNPHGMAPAHVVVQHRPVHVMPVHHVVVPVHHMMAPRTVVVKHYAPVHVVKKPMHGNI